VPLETPELVQARNFGRPVIGELELAARFLKGKILAITGSNGKTTTTALAGEILKEAACPRWSPATSACRWWPDRRKHRRYVVGAGGFKFSTRKHGTVPSQDRGDPQHHARSSRPARQFRNYALAKERIFAAQDASDFAVLNADNARAAEAAARSHAPVFWISSSHAVAQGAWVENGNLVYRSAPDAATEIILPVAKIALKGGHNVENVLAAACAARLAGVRPDAIARAIENFKAVEHRLEYVATIDGVEYYNDSKATNVDATEKAVAAFAGAFT